MFSCSFILNISLPSKLYRLALQMPWFYTCICLFSIFRLDILSQACLFLNPFVCFFLVYLFDSTPRYFIAGFYKGSSASSFFRVSVLLVCIIVCFSVYGLGSLRKIISYSFWKEFVCFIRHSCSPLIFKEEHILFNLLQK